MVGLDMGSYSVKVVQLEEGSGTVRIKQLISESRPDSDLEITANETVKRILNRSGLKTRDTITSLPSRDVNEKFISLHDSASGKLDDILAWEVKKHINYPIEEAAYDYYSSGDGDQDQLSVHLAITPRDRVVKKVRSLLEAGFSCSVIETESRAIMRIVSANEDIGEIQTGVVNLGSSSSTFIVIDRGTLKFCRDIDVTGEDIDRTISKMLHIDMERSEIAKREIGLDRAVMEGEESEPTSVSYNVYSAIESHIDRLISEIGQSVHYYGIQSDREIKLDRLYVTGGNSLIRNLIPFMETKMKMDIKLFEPASFYSLPADEPEKENGSLADFTVAIGLALRGI
jgi:type IV pilus assembly protein PilM